jgi:bifunctional DNA-binding transcriptional regulator/antitoxin component of YhaV-PrlF toxin-antitoxin module
MNVIKIRPAWSGNKGRGGAIISIPVNIRTAAGVNVGDSLSISVVDGKIILSKIIEV